MQIEHACPLCGQRQLQPSIQMHDSASDNVMLYFCPVCSSFVPDYFDRRVGRDEIAAQVSYHEKLWEAENAERYQNIIMRGFPQHFVDYIGKPEDGKLICDVGAGRANLLQALRLAGYNAIGCEPSTFLISEARKYYYMPSEILLQTDIAGFLSHLQEREQKPSVFILWHVVEHLEAPIDWLRRLQAAASDDVTFIMQTPMLRPDYIFSEHLFLPTPQSMLWMAQQLNLRLVRCNPIPDDQYMSTVITGSGVQENLPPLPSLSNPDEAVGYMLELYLNQIAFFRERVRVLSQQLQQARNSK